jgi:antitoxin ParD1/3/4
MQVVLDPELEHFVEQQVRAGLYSSASEVVADALTLLKSADADTIPADELRRLIAEGQAEADRGEFIDGAAVFAELREHSQRQRSIR